MPADTEPDPFVSSAKLLLLLFSLIFLLVIVPMLSGTGYASVLWRAGLTIVIILAAIATTRHRDVHSFLLRRDCRRYALQIG